MTFRIIRLDAASCNARLVRLLRVDHSDHAPEFVVAHPGDMVREGDGEAFETEAEARVAYEKAVTYWMQQRNYEAQARYDAEGGTDNGYAYPPREY